MFCPECNHNLQPISLKPEGFNQITGPYQNKVPTIDIVLDYCPNCGGVWSDAGETNFLQMKQIEPLISSLPNNPAPTNANYQLLVCPKDRQILRIFKRESIPMYLNVLRCQTCGGIWFPQNNFAPFKKAQEAKINYFKLWNIPLPSIYAVLLPVLIFALLIGGLISTITNIRQNQEVRIKASDAISQPLTIQPKNYEMLISFTTKETTATKIKYWTEGGSINEVWVSETPKTNHLIKLTNLDNKTYSYQIILPPPVNLESQVNQFTVKPQINPY